MPMPSRSTGAAWRSGKRRSAPSTQRLYGSGYLALSTAIRPFVTPEICS